MKTTSTLLVHTTVWLGETTSAKPLDPFMKRLGFKKIVVKTRTFMTRVFSTNYTDNQGISQSFNFYYN